MSQDRNTNRTAVLLLNREGGKGTGTAQGRKEIGGITNGLTGALIPLRLKMNCNKT